MLKITMKSGAIAHAAPRACPKVAVIGGGFAGATVARLLAERGFGAFEDITVFEPRADLGCGLAYDTEDPHLRLNVAAHRMRAMADAPGAFLEWLRRSGTLSVDPEAMADGAIYARRRDFGRFMRQSIEPLIARGFVRHVAERVVGVQRQAGLWHITGANGTTVDAGMLVIATGHPGPCVPAAIASASQVADRVITDVLGKTSLDDIGPHEALLVVGSGLTALDVVARLDGRGHGGKLTLLSRSGFLPRQQARGDFSPCGDFLNREIRTARQLVRAIRVAIGEAEDRGIPWQFVFDTLRQQGQRLWAELGPAERDKLVRRLRRFYEVHRFRMAPQIAAALEAGLCSGRIEVMRGAIDRVDRVGSKVAVAVLKGSRLETVHVDRILLATGPESGNYCGQQRWLAELERDGFLRNDALGLGLDCDGAGRAMGRDGAPAPDLFIAGPPARAAFGELTGVPEVSAQAAALVDTILRQVAQPARTIWIKDMA